MPAPIALPARPPASAHPRSRPRELRPTSCWPRAARATAAPGVPSARGWPVGWAAPTTSSSTLASSFSIRLRVASGIEVGAGERTRPRRRRAARAPGDIARRDPAARRAATRAPAATSRAPDAPCRRGSSGAGGGSARLLRNQRLQLANHRLANRRLLLQARPGRGACSDRRTDRRRRGSAARWPRTSTCGPDRSSSTRPAAASASPPTASHSVDSASSSAVDAERFLPSEVAGPLFLAVLQVFLTPGEELIARARGSAPRSPSRGRARPGRSSSTRPAAPGSRSRSSPSPSSRPAPRRDRTAPALRTRLPARSSFCAAKNADVRAKTSSCAVLKRRHIASPCARGASATCFQRACSSRMRRPATSRFSSALSASISRQISSCTCRLAQRCHSSASRSSWTRGASCVRASSSRAWISWRSRFDGSGARSSSADADLAQRAIAGLERQRLGGGQRLDLAAELLQAAQVVLLLLGAGLLVLQLFLFESRDGPLEPLGRHQVGRRVLAQHVRIAAQAAPARDHIVDAVARTRRAVRARWPASRAGRPPPRPAARRRSRSSNGARGILEPARQRRRVLGRHRRQAVPPHPQLGDPIDGGRDRRAARSRRRSPGDRPARARAPAAARARRRARARARRWPRARPRWRLRTGARAARRSRRRPATRPTPGAPPPAQTAASSGSAVATSAFGAMQQLRAARAIFGAHRAAGLRRRVRGSPRFQRSFVRARRAATLLRPRCAIADSAAGS